MENEGNRAAQKRKGLDEDQDPAQKRARRGSVSTQADEAQQTRHAEQRVPRRAGLRSGGPVPLQAPSASAPPARAVRARGSSGEETQLLAGVGPQRVEAARSQAEASLAPAATLDVARSLDHTGRQGGQEAAPDAAPSPSGASAGPRPVARRPAGGRAPARAGSGAAAAADAAAPDEPSSPPSLNPTASNFLRELGITAPLPRSDGPTIILRLLFPRLLSGRSLLPVPLDDVVPHLWLHVERSSAAAGAAGSGAAAAPAPAATASAATQTEPAAAAAVGAAAPARVLTRRQRQLLGEQQQQQQPEPPAPAQQQPPAADRDAEGESHLALGRPLRDVSGPIQLRVVLERRPREAAAGPAAAPAPAAAAAAAAAPGSPSAPAAAPRASPPPVDQHQAAAAIASVFGSDVELSDDLSEASGQLPESVVAIGVATIVPAVSAAGVSVPFTPTTLDGIARFVLLEVMVQHQLRQPKGVDEASLQQHTEVRTWGDVSEEKEMATCTVCTEDACAGETVRRLRCGHHFHASCVDQWLQRSSLCPNCREPVVPPAANRGAPAAAAAAAAAAAEAAA